MPFKSWECVTLTFKDRDVDLVIPNEKDQNLFVKFILYKMKTSDGMKNSGLPLIKSLLDRQIKIYYWKSAKTYKPS